LQMLNQQRCQIGGMRNWISKRERKKERKKERKQHKASIKQTNIKTKLEFFWNKFQHVDLVKKNGKHSFQIKVVLSMLKNHLFSEIYTSTKKKNNNKEKKKNK